MLGLTSPRCTMCIFELVSPSHIVECNEITGTWIGSGAVPESGSEEEEYFRADRGTASMPMERTCKINTNCPVCQGFLNPNITGLASIFWLNRALLSKTSPKQE